MSTWNADAYIVEAATAAETLSDPTLTPGRTHRLHNNSNASQVWSSVGATPFTVGGVNVATLTLAAGQSTEVVSNGAQWVATGGPARKIFSGTAVSNASGDAIFNFAAAGFTAPPVVTIANQTPNSTSIIDLRITALTATSCTVRVRVSVPVVLLAVSVYLLAVNLAGAIVHLHAIEAGVTP